MKLGPDERVVESRCLNCGHSLDAATVVDKEIGKTTTPDPGDFTICIKCGHLMAFAYDLTLRELTDEEIKKLAGDERILTIQAARKHAHFQQKAIEHARETIAKFKFPLEMTGHMVNLQTWELYIWQSNGSEMMKRMVVDYIKNVFEPTDGLLDSVKLGYALAMMSNRLNADGLREFHRTIKLTRDTANVPIVQVHGRSVA